MGFPGGLDGKVSFIFQGTSIFYAKPSAVILQPKKIKSITISTFSSICHEVIGSDPMILVFFFFYVEF